VIKVRDWLSVLVRLQLPISIMIEKKLISRSKKVTAVSRSVVKELAPYGLDEEAVVILRNGADAEVFRPSERNGREQPYILSVGRLGLRKGYEDLIQCAKMVVSRYPELQFKIAGKGPFENRLREQITNEGLQENVILLGHITDREELVRLFQGATVFLHPAHYEGLPTVLLEAMACGCACVSTAVSGALDVIVSGENGVLVPPYTPDEMAKAVIQLYEDPPLCNELGMAARKTIEAGYSWEKVGADYAALFEQVIKEG
jgi:glycosyltransferase involved in cell wall biosynthesis